MGVHKIDKDAMMNIKTLRKAVKKMERVKRGKWWQRLFRIKPIGDFDTIICHPDYLSNLKVGIEEHLGITNHGAIKVVASTLIPKTKAVLMKTNKDKPK